MKEGQQLPPVFPIVLYKGRKRWTAAREMAELIQPLSKGLGVYQPRQRYFLLDEGNVSQQTLDQTKSVTAALVRTPADVQEIIRHLVSALRGPRYDRLRRAFTIWINHVVLKRSNIKGIQSFNALEEVETMLAEQVTLWTQKWKQQSFKKGEVRGGLKGAFTGTRDTLLSLLAVCFGTVPPSLSEKSILLKR